MVWTWNLATSTCESSSSRVVMNSMGWDFDEFTLLSLPIGVVLRFCQGVSKNWRIDMIIFFVDWHQPPINCPILNVIETYIEFAHHHPTIGLANKVGPHPLLLHHKPKWRSSNEICSWPFLLIGNNYIPLLIH